MTKACLRRFGWYIVYLSALAVVAPAILSYAPTTVGWDDAHYLHQTLCLNHALFGFDLKAVGACLAGMHKSPGMAVFSLPWGPQAGGANGIGLASVALAVTTFAVFIIILELLIRLRVRALIVAIAVVALAMMNLPRVVAGAFQGDILVSALVTLLLILVPYEWHRPDDGWRATLGRGLLWGLVMAFGLLLKVTFGFFIAAAAPLLLGVRAHRSGGGAALGSTLIAAIVGAPVIAYHALYWDQLIGHALRSAKGPLALQTSYGLNAWGYLTKLFATYGHAPLILAFLLISSVYYLLRVERRGKLVVAAPLLILAAYLGITAASDNHDMRYALPFVIGFPLVLAAVHARGVQAPADSDFDLGYDRDSDDYDQTVADGTRTANRAGAEVQTATTAPSDWGDSAWRVTAALLIATLVSVPMVRRVDLKYAEIVASALATLPQDKPLKITVASDDSAINIDTFLLARQLHLPALKAMSIATVVYAPVEGKTVEQSLQTLAQSDAVFLLKAPIRKSPDWTNANAARFREHLTSLGARKSEDASGLLEIYQLK